MSLASLHNLSKTYRTPGGEVEALREINLEIGERDSVAIMGPSGSGKSTLLHLLGLLDIPTTGVCRFEGKDVSTLLDTALSQIRAEKIGFVFQAFHLIPQLTIIDNVALPLSYRPVKGEMRERAAHALERVGLAHRLGHRPEELSGGQKQRVAIARAIVGDPLLLLADEPTGNLDLKTGREILDLFDALGENQIALVTITHSEEVAGRFKRQIHVRDGRICAEI